MGSCLFARSQKGYNRPVELCFVGLNDRTLVSSATFCSILKLSCELIHCYIVLKLLLPTSLKIIGLISSQNGTNVDWSVPTSLQDPAINLYTSMVDIIHFRCLVESALKA